MSSRENLEARRAKLLARVKRLDAKIEAINNRRLAEQMDAAERAAVYTGVPADGCGTVLALLHDFRNSLIADDFTPFEYVDFIFDKWTDRDTPQVCDAAEQEPNPDAECVMTMTLTARYEMDKFILRDYFEKTPGSIHFVMVDKSESGLPVVKFYRFDED
jgi:hypothetical protein